MVCNKTYYLVIIFKIYLNYGQSDTSNKKERLKYPALPFTFNYY